MAEAEPPVLAAGAQAEPVGGDRVLSSVPPGRTTRAISVSTRAGSGK